MVAAKEKVVSSQMDKLNGLWRGKHLSSSGATTALPLILMYCLSAARAGRGIRRARERTQHQSKRGVAWASSYWWQHSSQVQCLWFADASEIFFFLLRSSPFPSCTQSSHAISCLALPHSTNSIRLFTTPLFFSPFRLTSFWTL